MRLTPVLGLAALSALAFILVFSAEPVGGFAKDAGDALLAERRTVPAGHTYFHRQTQHSLSYRLDYSTEQDLLRLVWMGAIDEQGSDSRGSYYTLYDLTDDAMERISDWKRVEFANAGWPDMAVYADGTVGISSHTPAQFSKNSKLREESFQTLPAAPLSSFFPRSAVGAQDRTHMVYTYVSGSKERHIFYVQSDDLGANWTSEQALTSSAAPDGAGPRMVEFDALAFDARNNDVALVYLDRFFRLHLRRSSDNGQSWQNLSTLMEPTFTRLNDRGNVQGQAAFVSDTVFAPGADIDVKIDAAGRIHLVFPLLRVYVSGLGSRNGGEIVRDGRDTIYVDTTAFGKYGLAYKQVGKDGFTQIGRPAGELWDGKGVFVESAVATNYTRFPQLALDADNKLYCVYTSVKNGDMTTLNRAGGSVENALFGHVYVTREINPGEWSVAQDLTPAGKDCLYGSIAGLVDEHLYIAWQQGNRPGLRLDGEAPELDSVMILRFPADELSDIIASVDSPTLGSATSPFELEVFPNPVQAECILRVDAQRSAAVFVELYDRIGRRIGTLYSGRISAGTTDLPLSLENFQLGEGLYYCTISDGQTQSGIGITIAR